MSGILAKEKEALSKEQGKLMKLIAALKKFLAKEFLWVLFVALLALPISILLNRIFELYEIDIVKEDIYWKILNGYSFSTETYLIGVVGIYFIRAVIGSIRTLTKNPNK